LTATACKSQEVNIAQRVAIKGGGYPKEEGQSSEQRQACHLARQEGRAEVPTEHTSQLHNEGR